MGRKNTPAVRRLQDSVGALKRTAHDAPARSARPQIRQRVTHLAMQESDPIAVLRCQQICPPEVAPLRFRWSLSILTTTTAPSPRHPDPRLEQRQPPPAVPAKRRYCWLSITLIKAIAISMWLRSTNMRAFIRRSSAARLPTRPAPTFSSAIGSTLCHSASIRRHCSVYAWPDTCPRLTATNEDTSTSTSFEIAQRTLTSVSK